MKPTDIDPTYNDLLRVIGEKVIELRKKKGLSYTDMAKEIGISRNGYNNIELAKANFQFSTLIRILSFHNISIFDFFKSLKQ